MNTNFVVTTATERVTLDNTRSAEVAFTVTNQGPRIARAVFDIRTGNGVETTWFTIDDPQRSIRPGASVPYPVRIAVPAQVSPGSYEFEARVCPPDAAPEENFVLSRRVLIEVPAPPAPPKRKWPWWLIAIAAAVLVAVISVVTWLVWPKDAPPPEIEPTPTPSVSAAPAEYTAVPKVLGMPVSDAILTLQKNGFAAGAIRYRFEPGVVGTVIRQGIPFSAQAPKGSRVDLEVPIPITKPNVLSPATGSNVTPNTMPLVTWSAVNINVTRWLVTVSPERCIKNGTGETCGAGPSASAQLVTTREHRSPQPKMTYVDTTNAGWRNNGWMIIQVQPVDDIGYPGDVASIRVYLEH